MSFTRQETLALLSSMGVDLPPSTKLPDDALEKRLKRAINCAQSISTALPSVPLQPSAIPAWPHTSGKTSLQEAISRINFGEALAIQRARTQGQQNPHQLYENPFMDLRQTLLAVARAWDDGVETCILQDAGKFEHSVLIRVRGCSF